MTERDMVAAWFDPLPKTLKLLHIAKNPDCEGVMHHYREWDVNALTFWDMLTSTQRVLIKSFNELRPENS